MGKFTYQTGTRVDFEDRVLAHLQVVISNKLRRGESFVFTCRAPSLNRAWIEALAVTANSPNGLYVIPEPAEVPAAAETDAL
jgi:hypothetical protein